MKKITDMSHILLERKEMDLIRHIIFHVANLYDSTESFLNDYLHDAPDQYSAEEIEQLLELLDLDKTKE